MVLVQLLRCRLTMSGTTSESRDTVEKHGEPMEALELGTEPPELELGTELLPSCMVLVLEQQ
jgi:hypothetical protein